MRSLLKRAVQTVAVAAAALGIQAGAAVALPAGYTQVAWIESSGTQWIDTGYTCTTATRIEASINTCTRSQAWGVFFGVTGGDRSTDGVLLRYYNSTATLNGWFCNADYNQAQVENLEGLDVEVVLESSKMVLNGVERAITCDSTPYASPLYLFCGNNAGAAWRHQAMRLYSFKISEGGMSKRDFVPCRNRDGVLGLWDRVDGVFYGNKGSGVFTGPIVRTGVTLPAGYTRLEWIASSGTQHIDTGYRPSAATEVVAYFRPFARSENWSAFFSVLTGDKSNNALSLRYYNNTTTINGMFCNATYGEATTTATFDNVDVSAALRANAMIINGTSYTITTAATPYQNTLILFGERNDSTIRRKQAMRLYSMTIFEGDTAKRDFVPCRDPNGVLGLYDLANGTFYDNDGDGAFAGADQPAYAKFAGSGYAYFNTTGDRVTAPASGMNGTIPLAFSNDAEYQALVAAPARVALASGVVLEKDTLLKVDADWSALEFDMNGHEIDIGGRHLKVASLKGTGGITSTGEMIANGGFTFDPLTSGSNVAMTPTGWRNSGTVRLFNGNTGDAYSQRNDGNVCYTPSGTCIIQSFTVTSRGLYRLSWKMANRNVSGSYWGGKPTYVRIDGANVFYGNWTNGGYQSKSYDVELAPGTHELRMGQDSGYNNTGTIFKNVSLTKVGGSAAGTVGILEVCVPEEKSANNTGVALGGGAALQLWKTGKGSLTMSLANNGFGVAFGKTGQESIIVMEGTVAKTSSSSATCGTQYSLIDVRDGGRFDVNGRNYWDYNYTIEGAGPDGAGALFNSTSVSSPWTASSVGYVRDITLVGNATIGGTQSWGMTFYNYSANTMTMNGRTLTYKGAGIYSGLMSYAGEGRIVIDEGGLVEFYSKTPSATDVDLEVRGTLQQHEGSLSPVKSLVFTSTGSFNNGWDASPLTFVVRTTYAPNLNWGSGSLLQRPKVQLGTENDLETTLDLSLFMDTFDIGTLTLFPASSVTVNLGARELAANDKIISWNVIPEVHDFLLAGDNVEAFRTEARADGLYLVTAPTYATIDPASGEWSFFGANDKPYPGVWTDGVTSEIEVRFSSLEEYEAIREANVTPLRYVLTGLTLTGDLDLSQGFPFVIARHTVIDLKGHVFKIPGMALHGSSGMTVTDSPTGYEELTYIESTGSQWIDTGVVPTTGTRIEAKFNTLGRSDTWSAYFGVTKNDSSADGVLVRWYNGTDVLNGWFCNSEYAEAQIGCAQNTDVEVVLERGQLTVNGVTAAITTTGAPYAGNVYLFCGNNGGAAWRNQLMRLYSFKMFEGDTATRDFVPVRRLSDNALGLLDRLHNVFYPNKGTGTFLAGAVAKAGAKGELHVDVPEGETLTTGANELTGGMKLVKTGAGTLVAGRAQTYYGGTQIDAGVFQLTKTTCLGPVGCEVIVKPTGVLEMAGIYDTFVNQWFVLAGGTLRNATGVDVDGGKAQIRYVRVTDDSSIELVNSYGIIGSGYAAAILDLGGHELTVSVAEGKTFWFDNVGLTEGALTVTGAGTIAIDKTSLRAAEADINLLCGAATVAVASEVRGWAVGAETTVTGAGAVTIHGAYKPIGDAVTSYTLLNGATLDLSGRRDTFDMRDKAVVFADEATIYVKPQPQKTGLIAAWNEPTNYATLSFLKAPRENGNLYTASDGIHFLRGLTVFLR